VRPADTYTYVTRYIPQIIDFVQALIDSGHAYVLDGDVYFSVPSYPDYGRLSGRNDEAMQAGARIEPDERKRDPRDFALWKSAKPNEPWWESPWGKGRPGWHIECSTMAMDTLGEQIDIHGGGTDLIFPHHENEIAQSESLTGKRPFVRYWVHTGMLTLPSGEKMAHSGRFVTVSSVLASGVPGPALRMYLLGQHYRSPLTFSEEQIAASVVRWRRWADTDATLTRLITWAEDQLGADAQAAEPGERERALGEQARAARAAFVAAMDDELNTSPALAAIDELVHRANDYAHGLGDTPPTSATLAALREAQRVLRELSDVLGIALVDVADTTTLPAATRAAIEALVAQRDVARGARNWTEADRIRRELDETYHVVIKDTPQGATWTVRD
jgi:cysteinyl-tRNA synthetase